MVVPRPAIVGILNVTPDSFSDGGGMADEATLLRRARHLIAAGASVLDVGGESTQPGFAAVSVAEELRRVVPAVRALAAAGLDVALSVDTRRAAVADAALRAGAHVVNDVSALSDANMAQTVARHGATVVLMHGFVAPGSAAAPLDAGEIGPVVAWLAERRDAAVAKGIDGSRIWLDPGLGFGKTLAQNLTLTAQVRSLAALGCPLLYGPSRKRFLGTLTGWKRPKDRDAATAACCALLVASGVDLVRVHEPASVRDALLVAVALRGSTLPR